MLVVGLATRLAALGLAVVMAGAILTAGLTVGVRSTSAWRPHCWPRTSTCWWPAPGASRWTGG
jgi:uncharacterized membrane protein YphA (DoxX/SURF4 family)